MCKMITFITQGNLVQNAKKHAWDTISLIIQISISKWEKNAKTTFKKKVDL